MENSRKARATLNFLKNQTILDNCFTQKKEKKKKASAERKKKMEKGAERKIRSLSTKKIVHNFLFCTIFFMDKLGENELSTKLFTLSTFLQGYIIQLSTGGTKQTFWGTHRKIHFFKKSLTNLSSCS